MNDKMGNQNYQSNITVQNTPAQALDKISRISEWWASDFTGKSQNLNDKFTMRFGDTFVDFKVIEFIPNKKIVWQVIDCNLSWISNKKEWKDTKIVWDISTKKNETQIDFTHMGLVPEIECYNDCKIGWNKYIKESLFKFLTQDKGFPDKF